MSTEPAAAPPGTAPATRAATGRPRPPASLAPLLDRPPVVLPALVVLAVLAAGAGLFAFQATLDEAYVYAVTEHGVGGVFDAWAQDPQALLPQLVAYPFGALASALWWLRLPALLAFAAAAATTWWAGRPLVGPRIAAGGAVLVALSPLGMITATDARWPAWALLSTVVAWGALLHAAVAPAGARRLPLWVLYTVAVALGVYCNALVVLMLPAHALALLLLGRRTDRGRGLRGVLRREGVPWAACVVVAGVLSLPLALALRASDAPNPLVRVGVPSVTEIPGFLAVLVGAGTPDRVRQLATLACLAVVAAGLVALARRHRPGELAVAGVLVGWIALPLAAAFVISHLGSSVWLSRYVVGVLPAVGLLLAWSAARLGPRRGPALFAALAIGFGAMTAYALVTAEEEPTEDWAHALAALRPPGAPVVFAEAEGVQVAGYYERQFRDRDGDVIVPAWDRTRVPPDIVLLDNPTFHRLPPAPPSAALVERLAARTGSVVMALRPAANLGSGVAWARAHCRVRVLPFGGVAVVAATRCRSTVVASATP